MSDKEKLLISIIIIMLGAGISYRIEFIDDKLMALEKRIDKITEVDKSPN